MKNETYQKLKTAYKELSTPQERFEDLLERLEEALDLIDPENLRGIDGVDGSDGRDGNNVSVEEILNAVLKRIPRPRDGRDGRDVDYEIVTEAMLGKLKGLKKLDISIFQLKDWQDLWRAPGNVIASGSSSSGGVVGNQVFNEVVTEISSTAWQLAHAPIPGTLRLYAIGQRLTIGIDFTLLGNQITTASPWSSGQLLADYFF